MKYFLTLFLLCPLWAWAQLGNCSAAAMTPAGSSSSCAVPTGQFAQPGERFPDTSSMTLLDTCWTARGIVEFSQPSTTSASGQCAKDNSDHWYYCGGQYDHQIVFATTAGGYNYLYNRGYDQIMLGFLNCPRNGGFHQDIRTCGASACSGGCPSPIAISLTGEDLYGQLSLTEDGVPYDLKGDGKPQWYSWQKRGSRVWGWLALTDANGNVPNGRYLFGNYTQNEDCTNPNQNNGWKALAEYTEKDNGGCGGQNLTSCDAVFSKLRVWVDLNHDGVAQKSELLTMKQAGIASISTAYTETKTADAVGNWYRYKGTINPLGKPPGSRVNPVAYDIYLRSRQIVYSSGATAAKTAMTTATTTTGTATPGVINALCCQTCGITK